MKKLFIILSVLVSIILPSVLLVGCGDKYKNMSLEVQFYECKLDENGEVKGEWVSVDTDEESEGYGLNFVLSDIYKEKEDDTYFSLRCRVLVNGTKKNIGQIAVSVSGTGVAQLNTASVKKEEEFVLKVFDSGSVTLTFVPSIKSEKKTVEFPVNLYRELSSISATTEYKPAVVAGGQLMLNELTDLINYKAMEIEGKGVGETNQRGVSFSIDGCEINENGEYILKGGKTGELVLAKLETKNNVNRLTVNREFLTKGETDETRITNYGVIKLKATSVYSYKTSKNEEISCEIFVVAVKNVSEFYLNYEHAEQNPNTSLSEIELFEYEGFNSSNLILSGVCGNDSGITFESKDFEDIGNLHYSVSVYVDGKSVNDAPEAWNGIQVEEFDAGSLQKGYTITASKYDQTSTNEIEFAVDFDGALKFTNEYELSKKISVKRTTLPTSMIVNGEVKEDGSSVAYNIYTDYEDGKRGLAIRIGSSRTTTIDIGLYTDSDCTTYDTTYRGMTLWSAFSLSSNTNPSGGGLSYILNEAGTVYFKFNEGDSKACPANVYVKLTMQKTPEMFEGKEVEDKEFVSVIINLRAIGALKKVGLTSDEMGKENDLFDLTQQTATLETGVTQMYLSLTSNGSVAVDKQTVSIKSKDNKIKFSADGVNFVESITCDKLIGNLLYFKGDAKSADKIVISSENGFEARSKTVKFVNVVTGELSLHNSGASLYKAGETDNYFDGKQGYYYALQRSKSVDFYFQDEDSKSLGIFAVDVISCAKSSIADMEKEIKFYGSSTVAYSKFANGFSVTGAVSNETTVLKMTVSYYSKDIDAFEVETKSKVIYFEIAVYSPMESVEITTDKSEIYYINDIISETASVNISITPDPNASTNIYFSDDDINKKLNHSSESDAGSIYGIKVERENGVLGVTETGLNAGWLDLSTGSYGLKVNDSVTSTTYISLRFVVVGLCSDLANYTSKGCAYIQSYYKTIKVIKATKSTAVKVEGTFKGNVYLSLNGTKTVSFTATISPNSASYKKLEYRLYEFDATATDNGYKGDEIVPDNFTVSMTNENKVKIEVIDGASHGGKYVLSLVSLDSYSGGKYGVSSDVIVNISDGSKGNPYYLSTLDDFKNIKNAPTAHYALASDINLSGLTEQICETFSGSIDGMVAVYDPNNNVISHTQYKLTNLMVDSDFIVQQDDGAYYGGLFGENKGEINNLVLEYTKIDLTILNGSVADLYIGALAGKNTGEIVNSSIGLIGSGVEIDAHEDVNSNYSSYSIGGMVGYNAGEIRFYDDGNAEFKQYSIHDRLVENYTDFTVKINKLQQNAYLNLGGVAGKNDSVIKGNYFDYKDKKTFNDYLTIRVNLKLEISGAVNRLTYANIGGVTGENAGEISYLAITGEIETSGDKINLGGVVGNNTAEIKNSTSYALDILANVENITTDSSVIVGGVAGKSNGTLEDVYVLMLDLTNINVNYTNKGKIFGGTVTGGIVGENGGGTLKNTNVQSFISQTDISGNVVGGLVGRFISGGADLCYVKANLKGNTVYSLVDEGDKLTNAYFVGQMTCTDEVNGSINIYTSSNVYVFDSKNGVLNFTTNYYYKSENDHDNWFTDEERSTAVEDNKPITSMDANWNCNDYLEYNYRLPVLIKNGETTLFALPTELITQIRPHAFGGNDADVSVNDEDGYYLAKDNVYTAIIKLSDREYDFIGEDEALISKTVLPTFASKEYGYKIKDGADKFSLKNNKIVFKKAGRIEIEFFSLFSSAVSDTVIFYVEENFDDLTILKGGNEVSHLNLYTGDVISLTPNVLFGDEISRLDISKLYFTLEEFDDDLIEVSSLVGKTGDKYSFGEINLKSKKAGDVTLTLNVYLNLKEYTFDDDKTLFNVYGEDIKLFDYNISLKINPSATNLKVNTSDKTVATGETISVEVEMETGFKNDDDTTEKYFDDDKFDTIGDYLTIIDSERDAIRILIETDEWVQSDLKAKGIVVNSLWELFNYKIKYVLNNNKTGYIYTLDVLLKEDYRDVFKSDRQFNFKIYANSNDTIFDSFTLNLEPQELTSLRIDNFKCGGAYYEGNQTVIEYTSSDIPSSLIEPGKSGLLKLYVEPSYARVDEIVISSEPIQVNGKTYKIRFEQMIFDRTYDANGAYVNYAMGAMDDETNSLKLSKISFKEANGELRYTGVIFVRTILASQGEIYGLEETFNIKVSAKVFDRDSEGNVLESVKTEKTVTKLLKSQYKPGLSLSVENGVKVENDDGKYIVGKNTQNLKIYAKIWGYDRNSTQDISVSWLNNTVAGNISDNISYEASSVNQQTDGSFLITYTLKLTNLAYAFKFNISVGILSDGGILDTESKELIFYPTDYLPSSVYLKGSASDILRVGVNSSKNLEFVWLSGDGTALNNTELNKKLIEFDNEATSKIFFVKSYDASGAELSNGIKFNENNSHYMLKRGINVYSLEGLGEYYQTIYAKIRFKYELRGDKYELEFTDEETSSALEYSFALDIRVETSEEDPDPIYSAETFLASLTDGANLILMNDIELENWVPITAKIASLDGNNKRIKIKSFRVSTSSTEILGGLFATISEDTIVKNLTIDLSTYVGNDDYTVYLADENSKTANTYFGFLAGRNEGNVYNCEVINTTNNKTITISTSSNTSYIGGLVGENNGNITNSRFGTSYFLKLKVNEDGSVSEERFETKVITLKGSGIMGGLVGINNSSAIISSSYFYNANLVNLNTKTMDEYNKTAGLVAVNAGGGKVLNSYAKGTGISQENPRGTGTCVESTKAGSVAGFVFENSGTIENCYSNILVKSSAGGVAGFVYRNNAGAVISKAYSASKVISDATDVSFTTQLPFVGVGIDGSDHNRLLSDGELNNCYYLKFASDEFSTKYDYSGDQLAYPLDSTNIANSENLTNFAFVNGDSEQEIQGIWTYFQTIDKHNSSAVSLGRTILPELTSANQISRSIREIRKSNSDDERYSYIYGLGYELGSSNNPYIIRDSEEYNKIFSVSSTHANVLAGHFRLISDISFRSDESESTIAINSSKGYILGDSKNHNITVFDGNGMTISEVNIKNTDNRDYSSVGMFSEIYYSIVKNLNVEYSSSMEYTSTKAIYSGGLAGKIKDSFVIELTISGQNSQISAQNFAGGVAGIVLGDSGLFNINVDINVKTGYAEATGYNQYLSESQFSKNATRLGFSPNSYSDYLKKLSYAGGVAGVVDINSDVKDFTGKTNMMKVTVGKNGAQVVGDIAGYIAGYLGRGVKAVRLKSVVSAGSYVSGSYIAGGLVGENYASIEFSQVASEDEAQDGYDDNFAKYILSANADAINNNSGNYGNLSFVQGHSQIASCVNYAGGFVGVNLGGVIKNSYTKGSINANSRNVGGFVGATIGGGYDAVYAENYINLTETDNSNTRYVGGFSGLNIIKSFEGVSRIYSLMGYNQRTDTKLIIDNIVVSNFYDKAQLTNIEALREEENAWSKNLKVTNFIAKSGNAISSNEDEGISVNIYYLSYDNLSDHINSKIIKNEIYKISSDELAVGENRITLDNKPVEELYNLEHENQSNTFDALFANFDKEIWDKLGSAHEHYMPKLTEKNAVNYYEIRTENDLQLIELHPDGDFKLMGNIELTYPRANHVIFNTFTGTLTGELREDGSMPSISGIKIYTTDDYSTAGFFQKTDGASISGINFVYDYMVICNTEGKDYVGLLSSDDNNSEFVSVSIGVNTNYITDGVDIVIDGITTISNSSITNSYNGTQIFTVGSNVNTFGGLLGKSLRTKIESCNVEADSKLSSDDTVTTQSYWGGLVGDAKGSGTNKIDYIIKNSSYKGNTYLSNFTYIGGIMGQGENVNASYLTAELNGADDSKVSLESNKTMYVGGIFGIQKNSYSNSNKVVATINKVSGTGLFFIGGASGSISNMDVDRSSDIEGFSGKFVLNIKLDNAGSVASADKKTLVYGGLAGLVSQNVKMTNSVAWTMGCAEFNTIYFGGSIGRIADTTQLVYLDNVFNYLEGDSDASGVEIKASTIYAGGFYGDIASNNAVISTNNSHTTGAIWACSGESTGGDRALVMGGLVGLWGKEGQNLVFNSKQEVYDFDGSLKETYSTIFNNVYTTVALESSKFTVGQVEYEINALFGRLVGENVKTNENLPKLKVNNLYYSSDYNLAVEERDMFDGLVKNLLSGAMLEVDQKEQYFGDRGWTIDEYGLPYRTNLIETMKKLPSSKFGSLADKFGDSAKGGSLRPIMINSEQISSYGFTARPEDAYKYYFISKTKLDELATTDIENRAINLFGELKGFLLGGGALIMDYKPSELATLTSNTVLESMSEHSVISNLQIQLNSTLKLQNTSGNGGVVNINNGTIFYCFVDYYAQTEAIYSGGGIAGRNNGNILYSYNTGTLDKVSSTGSIGFGGICNENNGFIYSSGFVGGFSSTGGGICVNNTNNGAIKNCYSAGVLGTNGAYSTLVKENAGTIRNSYYDKYANAEFDELKSADETEVYIKALATSELQLNYSNHLTGSWRTYRMERVENGGASSFSDYYNYGYPVYHLEQLYFDASIGVNEEKTYFRKGLFTGNGSEAKPYLISNMGTLESINTFTKTSDVFYKLINDIDFNKNKKNGTTDTGICGNWTGISKITTKVTENGEEREMTTEAFAGKFDGGTRGAGIWIHSDYLTQALTEINRKIANLKGESGLFNETGDGANISNLTICGAELAGGKSSLGALINIVNGFTTLSQIHFSSNSGTKSELSISATHVGGIIGRIAEGKKVDIAYVNKAKDGTSSSGKVGSSVSLYTAGNATNMGLIVGLNAGELSIEEADIVSGSQIGLKEKSGSSATNTGAIVGQNDTTGKITIKTSSISGVSVGAENAVGGIVGVTSGEVILHISCKIGVDGEVKLGTFSDTGSHMGGVIGNIKEGGALNVETKALEGISTEQSLKVIVSLGGFEEQDDFAGQYVGGIAGSSVANIKGKGKVEVTIKKVKAEYGGGAVGNLNGGTVSGLIINLGNVDSSSEGTSEDNMTSYAEKGFGGVVGKLDDGKVGEIDKSSEETTETTGEGSEAENKIVVKGSIEFNMTPQLGGAVAYMQSGRITNLDLAELKTIKAGTSDDESAGMTSGQKGIGGIIGVVMSAISLGSVSMSQMEISADKQYENIGGLIGYLGTDSISHVSDKDELKIEGLIVKGVVNVGGFVGQYHPNLSGEEETVLKLSKTLGDLVGSSDTTGDKTGFADIQLVTDESGSGNNVLMGNVTSRNIGGLFGYFNAKGTLGYALIKASSETESDTSTEGEENSIKAFANYNKVLYYTQTADTGSGLSNYSAKDKYIENVGGIAGLALTKTIQGVNEIDIGSSNEPKNYATLTYDNARELKIYRMKNVGGLVGNLGLADASATDIKISDVKIGSQTISGYENVGGVVGYINVQNKKIEYGNIEASATVGGFYQVGGLVGYSDGIVSLEDTDDVEISLEGEVYGRTDVGGLFGYMTSSNASDESKIKNIKLKGKVYGITNIGGMVGQIKNVNTMISATSEEGVKNTDNQLSVEVKGNANVGGIVGLFLHETVNVSVDIGNGETESQTVMTKSVIRDFDVNNLKVYAGCYEYGNKDGDDIYYLPTSVGGLVGYADNVMIQNCQIRGNVSYRKLGDSSDKKVKQYASSVGNYIVGQGSGDIDKINISDDFRTYEKTGTGIGGFVGTFNPKITDSENVKLVGLKDSRTLVDINIENGINVGGLMGYCYVPKSMDEKSFGAQQIGGTITNMVNGESVSESVSISIVGAMGVGGVFGYLDGGSTEINVFTKEIKFNEVHVQQVKIKQVDPNTGEEVINYEPRHGEYVGGFAGRSTSLTAITIVNEEGSDGLKIDNTHGGYYGGVIGWLEGSLTAIEQADDVVNQNRYSSVPDDIFVNKDKHNYGGMVGLLSVTGGEHKVYGYHKFDFTVDTVLLNSVVINNSKVNVDEGEKNIVLSGIASLASNVDIAVTAKAKDQLKTNPLLDPNAETGWAYDYTMFRTVELGGTSDKEKVRETVYDASSIQGVGTDSENIVFTITDVNGESLMYTRFGIARFYQSSASNSVTLQETFKAGEANRLAGKEIATSDTSTDEMARELGVNKYEVVNLSNFLSAPQSTLEEKLKNFRSEKVYVNPIEFVAQDGMKTGKASWGKALNNNFTLSLYCIIYGSPSGQKQLFKIETIYAEFSGTYYYKKGYPYGTPTTHGLSSDPNSSEYKNKDLNGEQASITWHLADSGSLFDASGYVSGRIPDKKTLSEDNTYIITAIIKTLAGVAALGMAIYAVAHGGWVIGLLASVCAVFTTINNPLLDIIVGGISAGIAGLASLFQQQALHSGTTQKYMTTIYEGDYGVISQAYSRPWAFTGNTMATVADDMIYINAVVTHTDGTSETQSIPYIYYSKTRPTDIDGEFVMESDYDSGSVLAPLKLSAGDTMFKYEYYNGKYYINMFATETTYNYRTPKITDRDQYDHAIIERDGFTYVASELGISYEQTKSITITSHFAYDSAYSPNASRNHTEGYDYITVNGTGYNWKLSKSKLTIGNEDCGIMFQYWLYDVTREGAALKDVIALEYPAISSITNIRGPFYAYATKDKDDATSTDVNLEPPDQTIIYSGDSLKGKSGFDSNYYLKHTNNNIGEIHELTYYLASGDYFDGLVDNQAQSGSTHTYDMSKLNSIYPLEALDELDKQQVLYSGSTGTPINKLVISSQETLCNYFVIDVSSLGSSPKDEELKRYYNASNYYKYQNELYKYNKSYVIEKVGETNVLAQLSYSAKGSDLEEGKCKVNIGGKYVYTHYPYKNVDIDDLRNFSSGGFNPLSSPDSFSDYYFNEIVMVDFSGKSAGRGGVHGVKITGKTMTEDPKYTS